MGPISKMQGGSLVPQSHGSDGMLYLQGPMLGCVAALTHDPRPQGLLHWEVCSSQEAWAFLVLRSP